MAQVDTGSSLRLDPIWSAMREDATEITRTEPALASFAYSSVLNHHRFEDALTFLLSHKLESPEMGALTLSPIIAEAIEQDPVIATAARADLSATFERDAACTSYLEPFLFFKGFHALQAHRVAHTLWNHNRRFLAKFLQSRASEVFGVDSHPAAQIGQGIMIDHATGVVIGETAIVEDGVSLLQGVTLGGTGKESGNRHPKVRQGAMIGAGAKILGNIEIGSFSRVGAGSVVVKDVPPCVTVVGVPARVVGEAGCDHPAITMDQTFSADG